VSTDPAGALEANYLRGFQDGYEAAEAAANRSWRAEASWRPGLTEADPYVTIGGKRERVLSWRDRAAADMATLREAHAAGLHVANVPARCPECNGDEPSWPQHTESQLQHKGHYGVSERES
jgi:hypothetical protein